jgi:hypothetical protein
MISDIYRWSPRQFKQAESAGLFDGSKVELLAGIVFNWIVDLNRRVIEVHRLPAGKSYLKVEVYGEDDRVPVSLGGQSLGSVLVRDILP